MELVTRPGLLQRGKVQDKKALQEAQQNMSDSSQVWDYFLVQTFQFFCALLGLFGRNPESKITQANVDLLQKLDLIRHSLESARSALPLPECAELANDLKAELEVKFTFRYSMPLQEYYGPVWFYYKKYRDISKVLQPAGKGFSHEGI